MQWVVVLCSVSDYRSIRWTIESGMHAGSDRGIPTIIRKVLVESKVLFPTVRTSADQYIPR